MMNSRLLSEVKKDLPLYFDDFKTFWDNTLKNISDADLVDFYTNSLIFKNWKICLTSVKVTNLDEILDELHEDINASFFYGLLGQYRSAHMHLRSIIELSMQMLFFHQHEVEYEQWKTGDFRIKHEELSSYLKRHPYFKTEDSKHLIDNITQSWKDLSKHIHAETPGFFQTLKPSKKTKSFQISDVGIWKSSFLQTGHIINRLLLLFFKTYLSIFPSSNRDLLLRKISSKDLLSLGIIP